MIRFRCPACGVAIKAPSQKVGATATCPSCKHPIRVPNQGTDLGPDSGDHKELFTVVPPSAPESNASPATSAGANASHAVQPEHTTKSLLSGAAANPRILVVTGLVVLVAGAGGFYLAHKLMSPKPVQHAHVSDETAGDPKNTGGSVETKPEKKETNGEVKQPVSEAVVNSMIEFYEYFLELKIAEPQRKELRQLVLEAANKGMPKIHLNRAAAWLQLANVNRKELDEARQAIQRQLLENLRIMEDDTISRWIVRAYDYVALVRSDDALLDQAADQYRQVVVYLYNFTVLGLTPKLQHDLREIIAADFRKKDNRERKNALISDLKWWNTVFPKLSGEERRAIRESGGNRVVGLYLGLVAKDPAPECQTWNTELLELKKREMDTKMEQYRIRSDVIRTIISNIR